MRNSGLYRLGRLRIQSLYREETSPVIRIGLAYPVDDADMEKGMLVERGAEAMDESHRSDPRVRSRSRVVHARVAFEIAMRDSSAVGDLPLRCLFAGFESHFGDRRKQIKAFPKCLGISSWRWGGYGRPLDAERDYKAMTEALVSHVGRMMHGLYRREQLYRTAAKRPYRQRKTSEVGLQQASGIANDGAIRHYRDPFWQTHLPPCGGPNCGCPPFALNKRDMERITGHSP